jgi:plastocyanin
MKTKIKLLGVAFLVAYIGIVTAAYNKISYTKGVTTDNTIRIQNSAYTPASLSVLPNSKVTWVNDDNMVHTVTAADGSFTSGDITVGASYTRAFNAKGTVSYYDNYNQNMKGVLVVSDSAKHSGNK